MLLLAVDTELGIYENLAPPNTIPSAVAKRGGNIQQFGRVCEETIDLTMVG